MPPFIEIPRDVPDPVEPIESLHSARAALKITAPFSVFAKPLRWQSTDFPLRVCFFGGKKIRHRIADAAREWEVPGSSVRFDFGSLPTLRECRANESNHIRISFDRAGYDSVIGRESLFLKQAESSMNFAAWNYAKVEEERLLQIVRHEFGHALGLHHEHQNPLSTCEEEFNWDRVNALLTGPEWNIKPERVGAIMRRLHLDGIESARFDDESVMLYSLPPEYYHGGEQSTCYHTPNISISDDDEAAMIRFYPAKPARRS